jgi:protein tyrosine/serine phosphatase
MRLQVQGVQLQPTYRIVHAYALFIALLVVQGSAAVGQTPAGAATVTIENFGKINETFYRGSQPLMDQFSQLKNLGVKTVIDLRQDRVEEAAEWARAAGLQYINIPLTTKRAATQEQTDYFLKLVNDRANWPVYVHCKGGRHRTGEMTAIYRITHDGWSADQAYVEMKKYDFEDSFFYPRSLKKYVYTYYKQYASQKPSSASMVNQF